MKEISNLIEISVSTINRRVEKGTFPPKYKLSTQRVGFLQYQIDLWIKRGKKKLVKYLKKKFSDH